MLGVCCLPGKALAASQVVAWGDNTYGQTNVPANLTNVVAIAGGQQHCLALSGSGAVLAWGSVDFLTNVPPDATNIVAVSAGDSHSLALRQDGTVTAWGPEGWGVVNVPAGLSNVVAINGGASSALALKSDGTLVRWGYYSFVPEGLTNVVAASAARNRSQVLAVKGDGTVVAWGDGASDQTNVPPGLSGVVSVSASGYYSLALKADGTVISWARQQLRSGGFEQCGGHFLRGLR